jgi:hypothetical protein
MKKKDPNDNLLPSEKNVEITQQINLDGICVEGPHTDIIQEPREPL